MLLAGLQSVTKQFGAQVVLRDVSFQVSSGQKIGLIGPNGSGKTTILRLLLGLEPPSEGNAVLARAARVGYVPQHVEYDDEETIDDCILREFRDLKARLGEAEAALSHAAGRGVQQAMRAYQRARDDYDRIEGHWFPERAGATLDALGLGGRGAQKIGFLSGGEKNVLALAQALLEEPDLLLLDEPGNHLDYLGVAWLEDFLSKFNGAVLIVSHNRYLLDRLVQGVLHLENGTLDYYEGGYSNYRASRLRHLIARQADYVANQKRLGQLEALVQRFAEIARGSSDPKWGRRLRARRKQLERAKAQAVEKPTLGPSAIRPDFEAEASRADIALQLRGYSKAFGDLKLFQNVDLDISCGERVALVGPNGCGKTTLLRDVVRHGAWGHPTIRIGPSLSIGYCAQEQEILHGDRTVYDEIASTAPIGRGAVHGVLARFLFGADDLRKRVRDLSGGERNRLQLARLMVLKPNFLILDEPTNHLDILAREAVEEALADFEGTILVVSHDRYFLDKVAERVVEVRDRALVSYPGNFSDFWYARQRRMSRPTGRVATRGKERRKRSDGGREAPSLAELERRIAEAEQRKLELERRIAQAFGGHDRRAGRRTGRQLEQLQNELDELYGKWLAGSEEGS